MDPEAFAAVRAQKREELVALKAARRVQVGPFVSFTFESEATLWWQIQEMLRIEGGGEAQLEDEISAYSPLLPQGSDWVATVMLEIPDAPQRRKLLEAFGHIEDHFWITWDQGDYSVQGIPVDATERTTDSGKTSAVHFVRFPFSGMQRKLLKRKVKSDVMIRIDHPHYTFTDPLSDLTLAALQKDLA